MSESEQPQVPASATPNESPAGPSAPTASTEPPPAPQPDAGLIDTVYKELTPDRLRTFKDER